MLRHLDSLQLDRQRDHPVVQRCLQVHFAAEISRNTVALLAFIEHPLVSHTATRSHVHCHVASLASWSVHYALFALHMSSQSLQDFPSVGTSRKPTAVLETK